MRPVRPRCSSRRHILPLGVNLVRETTMFREYGPVAGQHDVARLRVRAEHRAACSRGRPFDADARYYMRLGTNGVLALRARGYKSWGEYPGLPVLRRQLRDARLRLPAVPRQQGVLHQRRAALPDHRGDADADRRRRRPARRLLRQLRRRRLQRRADRTSGRPARRSTRRSSTTRSTQRRRAGSCRSTARRGRSPGFRLIDSRASYGFGLETFALGFPMHFDWSWRTLFNKDYEDSSSPIRGSSTVSSVRRRAPGSGKVKFSVWIGYDF